MVSLAKWSRWDPQCADDVVNSPPPPWPRYLELLPALKEVVYWQPLRRLSLSEVFRVTMSSDETLIAKLGRDSEANELDIHRSVLAPLRIPSPKLIDGYRDESVSVMLFEDIGSGTVDEDPQPKHFLEAASHLARIRLASMARLAEGALPEVVLSRYYVPDNQFVDDLRYLETKLPEISPSQGRVLEYALSVIPPHIYQLYRELPVAVVHNDFHAKNLLTLNGGIAVIDWSGLYLSPHLGDLSCLTAEASDFGVTFDALVESYLSQASPPFESTFENIAWQINVGGACWTIRTLRWLVDFGKDAIPVSREWIPGFIVDIQRIAEDLES